MVSPTLASAKWNLATAAFVGLCYLTTSCTIVPRRSGRGVEARGREDVNARAERAGNQVRPPRILSDHQRKLLLYALRSAAVGKVEIVFERGNDEAANFANQITTALLLAGQLAEFHSLSTLDRHAGTTASLRMQLPGGPVPAHAEAILNAFNEAHIPWESAIATGGPAGVLVITVESR